MIPSFYQIGDKLVAARDIKLTNDGCPYYSLNARVIKLENAEPGMISYSRLWTAAEAVHYQSTNASVKPKTSLNWAEPSQPRQQSAVVTPAETPATAAISPQPRMEQPASVANYAAKPTSAPVTTADPGLAHHDDLKATDHRTMFVVKRASEWMELASKQRTGRRHARATPHSLRRVRKAADGAAHRRQVYPRNGGVDGAEQVDHRTVLRFDTRGIVIGVSS